jgi:hypothetical protein
MSKTLYLTKLANGPLSPITVERLNKQPSEGPTANASRRGFKRTLGFWFGGLIWGAGGCLFGASMPYQHPVGVAISIIWWGIYFGCFGTSLGALLGLWAESRWHPRATGVAHDSARPKRPVQRSHAGQKGQEVPGLNAR